MASSSIPKIGLVRGERQEVEGVLPSGTEVVLKFIREQEANPRLEF